MLFSYTTSFIVFATGPLTITHRIHAQQTVPLKQIQHDAQFTYALVQYQIITVRRVLNQFLVQHLDANLKILYRVFGINSHGFQDAF